MKSISLYVDKDTYLTRMHPFTKLCYILTAIAASLIAGKLWAFAIFIGISLVMLISGKIMKKVFPLIAFSFTILLTIFLIHGLFNHENANLMFQLGPLKFYWEGMMYALRISCNILIKAYLPEIPVKVIASCCAGVTPKSHEAALTTMKMCQVQVE